MKLLYLSPLLLAGCASPGDVEVYYAGRRIANEQVVTRTEVEYHNALATANEWNHHVLGIPASGWLAILIIGIIGVVILAICGGTALYHLREQKIRCQANVDVEIERTKQRQIEADAKQWDFINRKPS